MIQFEKLTKESYKILAPYFKGLNYVYADYSLGYIYMYDEHVGYEYKIENDILHIRYKTNDKTVYLAPICSRNKFLSGIDNILNYAKNETNSVVIRSVPDEFVELICQKVNADIQKNEKWADYIYNAMAFSELKGKKYHAKRNYISRFKRLYEGVEFEEISIKNLEKVKSFFERFKSGENKSSKIFNMELSATELMLNDLSVFDIETECMILNDEVIGFTIGEVIGNTLIVHIEKCDKSFEGVYETLTNHFARRMLEKHPEIEFINREDDAGDEGLKKAKLSYHPLYLAVKNDLILDL